MNYIVGLAILLSAACSIVCGKIWITFIFFLRVFDFCVLRKFRIDSTVGVSVTTVLLHTPGYKVGNRLRHMVLYIIPDAFACDANFKFAKKV